MKAKNQQKNLQTRIGDWGKVMDSQHPGQSGLQKRIETGGFHKPGSNKK
ncbi:MAG: hypothetical protein KGI11_09055 [Thaumarchaeota archaeon]|nr:hypothetical protein [Nitrososphaerota archaeon]